MPTNVILLQATRGVPEMMLMCKIWRLIVKFGGGGGIFDLGVREFIFLPAYRPQFVAIGPAKCLKTENVFMAKMNFE